MKTHPTAFRDGERRESTRPVYAYIVDHGGTLYHLTNLDESFSLTSLPVTHGSDPQTFTPAQIGHSSVDQQSEMNSPNVMVTLGLNGSTAAQALKALVLTAVPSKITVIIARLNPEALTSLDWEEDAYVIFKGVATNVSFARYTMQLSLVSVLMQNEGKVPRYFWQKTCQHALYGDLCGADPEDADNKLSTTIAAVSARAKFVDIADTTLNGNAIASTTFQGGTLTIGSEVFQILASTLIGGGGGTRLYLVWWSTSLVASASVVVRRGCRRTVEDCEGIFDNLANFGGMPYIPDVNPTVNGIRTSPNA